MSGWKVKRNKRGFPQRVTVYGKTYKVQLEIFVGDAGILSDGSVVMGPRAFSTPDPLVAFSVAHEHGHFMNGDVLETSPGQFVSTTGGLKDRVVETEFKADLWAYNLLGLETCLAWYITLLSDPRLSMTRRAADELIERMNMLIKHHEAQA